MPDSRIANRYAGALFATAKKINAVSNVGDDLNFIASLVEKDARFKDFLFNPETGFEDKQKLLETVFSDRVSLTTFHFLKLLLNKRREDEILHIRADYDILRREFEKIVFVEIESAMSLNETEQGRLIEKARLLTGKEVEAHFSVDPSLIGGVKISYDNTVVDGSLRLQLSKLTEHLKNPTAESA